MRHRQVAVRILVLVAWILAGAWSLLPQRAQAQAARFDPDNCFMSMTLSSFFPGQSKRGPKNLNIYMVRREGQWIAGVGTATISGRAVWNTAIMVVDPTGLTVKGTSVTGVMKVTLVPDPWIPKDQKARLATVEVQAVIDPTPDANSLGKVTGTYKMTTPGKADELAAADLQPSAQSTLTGGVAGSGVPSLANTSIDLAVYNLIPGKTEENFHRRRGLSLGVVDGKIVSARIAQMDMRHSAYDHELVPTPTQYKLTPDSIEATVSFEAMTLDGDPAQFTISLAGRRVANWMAGSWSGSVTLPDGKTAPISGFFRADVRGQAYVPQATSRDDRPWFVPVKDFKAVQPGEHPRVFFRKSDVPELRRRAATPDGQRIIARLRQLLDGSNGESMPIAYNPATKAYEPNKFKQGPGAYSISHAAGYGFLYQITGDKKYADFARQCVEKAFAGQRSADDRYSWVAPGGELRAGPSIGWTAVAYDLCYDAWEPAFRSKVALAIQNYADEKGGEWNKAEGITLEKMVLQPRQGPGSNHFGAVVGGCGLAVLSIHRDPGTDDAKLTKYLEVIEKQVVRHMIAGWGDGGYYKEGWGASRVGTQGGFLCFLQALRTAMGRDYLNVERTNASFITMVPRVLMVLGPPGYFPYRSNMGPTYGNPEIGSVAQRDGFSDGGYFSEGFGAIADKYKPGLLWMYNHVFNADGKDTFDTYSNYPHRPMLALINWPTFSGVQEENPAKAMPLVTRDKLYDYFVFRNRFQDKNDLVTTVIAKLPDGTKPRGIMVWGMGTRNELGENSRGGVSHFVAGADGSGLLTTGSTAMAIDYSKASGADGLIVTVGVAGKGPSIDKNAGAKVQTSTHDVGGVAFTVVTLSAEGQHPQPKVEGKELVIGKQRVSYDGANLAMSVFTPAGK